MIIQSIFINNTGVLMPPQSQSMPKLPEVEQGKSVPEPTETAGIPETSREAARTYLLKFYTYNLHDWREEPPPEITDKVDSFGEEARRLNALYPGVFVETTDEYHRLVAEMEQGK